MSTPQDGRGAGGQHWAAPAAGWGAPASATVDAPTTWGTGRLPAPPPRRRRRVVLVLVGLVLVAAVVVGLLAFAVGPRFARVTVLDHAAVEQGVTRIVTQDWKHAVTGVRCPADEAARPGTSFSCSATVDGRPQRVPVDVLDARGLYQVGQPR